jgi:hypothetical protein
MSAAAKIQPHRTPTTRKQASGQPPHIARLVSPSKSVNQQSDAPAGLPGSRQAIVQHQFIAIVKKNMALRRLERRDPPLPHVCNYGLQVRIAKEK